MSSNDQSTDTGIDVINIPIVETSTDEFLFSVYYDNISLSFGKNVTEIIIHYLYENYEELFFQKSLNNITMFSSTEQISNSIKNILQSRYRNKFIDRICDLNSKNIYEQVNTKQEFVGKILNILSTYRYRYKIYSYKIIINVNGEEYTSLNNYNLSLAHGNLSSCDIDSLHIVVSYSDKKNVGCLFATSDTNNFFLDTLSKMYTKYSIHSSYSVDDLNDFIGTHIIKFT